MGIVDDQVYLDEFSEIQSNIHAPTIRRVFEIARIEYGRVDFGLVDGKPQFYEINFNSNIQTISSKTVIDARKQTVDFVLDRYVSSIADLSSSITGSINNISDPEITACRFRPWRNYAPQRY